MGVVLQAVMYGGSARRIALETNWLLVTCLGLLLGGEYFQLLFGKSGTGACAAHHPSTLLWAFILDSWCPRFALVLNPVLTMLGIFGAANLGGDHRMGRTVAGSLQGRGPHERDFRCVGNFKAFH